MERFRRLGLLLTAVLILGMGGCGSSGVPAEVGGAGGPAAPTIGYVGCSMSSDAVLGYEALGGTRIWLKVDGYGGGGIFRWAGDLSDASEYWAAFQAALVAHPSTQTIWWQLCTLVENSGEDNYNNAVIVLREILTRFADASMPKPTIYISAQPAYEPGHVCTIAGDGGPGRMQEIADQLVANGEALAGPVMGPLLNSDLDPDGCHADDDSGKPLMGRRLIDFFGP